MSLALSVTIFFSGGLGSVFEACYREAAKPQVCQSVNAVAGSSDGRAVHLSHSFTGLTPGAVYEFTFKENGVESYPMKYQADTPATVCPGALHPNGQSYKEHWLACRTTTCQLWEMYRGECPWPIPDEEK